MRVLTRALASTLPFWPIRLLPRAYTTVNSRFWSAPATEKQCTPIRSPPDVVCQLATWQLPAPGPKALTLTVPWLAPLTPGPGMVTTYSPGAVFLTEFVRCEELY